MAGTVAGVLSGQTPETRSLMEQTSVAWTPPIVVPRAEGLDAAAALLNAGKKTVISYGTMRGDAG
jgi:hypothetical protein